MKRYQHQEIFLTNRTFVWVDTTFCGRLQAKFSMSFDQIKTAYTSIACGESPIRSRETRRLMGRYDAGEQAKSGRYTIKTYFKLNYYEYIKGFCYHNI